MRFVLYGTFVPVDQLVEVACLAEQLGFDGITIPDHVIYPARYDSPYPYAAGGRAAAPAHAAGRDGRRAPWDEELDWPDPLVVAGAIAARTTRLRVITGIYVLALRDPLLVAKSLATIDALAPGRIVLGVGAGWLAEEFTALGRDFRSRGSRTDEMIDVLRRVLSGERVAHDGEHFSFEELSMRPVPRALPPIVIGGDSAPAVRRAALRGDGLLPPLSSGPRTRELRDELARQRAEAGREGPFELIAAAPRARDAEAIAGLAELGVGSLHVDPFALYVRSNGGLSPTERRSALERYAREVVWPYREATRRPQPAASPAAQR
ncbi:MAG TPA: TIGR03619 family F420-dependent LLM class oxidoreductase [Conexibacter sp.]|jgi:probable F420-dependent oxidoreductase